MSKPQIALIVALLLPQGQCSFTGFQTRRKIVVLVTKVRAPNESSQAFYCLEQEAL